MPYARGINMLALNGITGNIIRYSTYDTHTSASDANVCASAIDSLSIGSIVMIAVYDDAYNKLTQPIKVLCLIFYH